MPINVKYFNNKTFLLNLRYRNIVSALYGITLLLISSCFGYAYAAEPGQPDLLTFNLNNSQGDYEFKQVTSDNLPLTLSNSANHPDYLSFNKTDLDLPPVLNEVIQTGGAFIANFAIHEVGHKVLADYIGAKLESYKVLSNKNGEFFFGVSTYRELKEDSRISYSLAGEVATDLAFEHALKYYRQNPSLFNGSLLFFSGTDFLMYCAYAFYLSDGHDYYDPVSIAQETGLSKDAIFSVALAKTLLNAARVYTGKDYVVPYFSVSRHNAMINFRIAF